MSNNTQTARIFIQDPIHANALGDIYICEDIAQIAKNGHLFILINLSSPQSDYEQFVGAFIEKCINTYYYCVLEDSTKILEYTLNEVNKWLPTNLPANKKILNHLNIVIGNLKDNLINMSLIGDWQAYLIHPLKASKLQREHADINPIKLFNEIHQIEFTKGGGFIMTNPSLLDYLSIEKVRKIVTTIPARSAAEQLRSMVSTVPTNVSFLSIIIKNQEGGGTDHSSHASDFQQSTPLSIPKTNFSPGTETSRESLDQLISTQKRTQKIMTVPSSWQTISLTWSNLKDKVSSSKLGPLIVMGIGKIFIGLWMLLKFLGRGLIFVLIKIKKIITSLIKPDHVGPRTRNRISFSWLSNLNRNKLILTTIGLLIIILVIILAWPNTSLPLLSDEEFLQITSDFTAKEEAIEAALIYGDRIRAQTLLADVIALLATLPPDKKQPDKYTDLEQRTDFLTERIWNIMTISEPVELFSIGTDITNGSFTDINTKDNLIYAFTDQTQYVIYDFEDKGYQIVDYPSNFAGVDQSTKAPNGSILVIDKDKKFFLADSDGLQPTLISLSAGLQDVTATTSFFNRLYILDGQTDQIYRHRMENNVFRAPDLWLKDNIDLTNSRDMAIDGFVYILADNNILKFTNGRQETFTNIDIYPELNQPEKMSTNAEIDNIYLLESSNQRIIILDKNGKLIKQYLSDKFINLQDFAIQEEEKRIFIITDKKLYVIPI